MGKQEEFVLRALEERDVRFVRLWFTDVLGFLKSVAVAPAELDGASWWQRLRHITIPQLKYTIITDSTLQLVGALTYFDLIYVLTGGGPGDATRILPLHMYLLGFKSFNMGQASVVGTILLVVGLALSLGLNRLSGSTKMESQVQGL